MKSVAVVLQEPGRIELGELDLIEPSPSDLVVDLDWTGISTGTERLLWRGEMPSFPGMGYPLVPGYEATGHVRAAGDATGFQVGQRVFVPGAHCFASVRSLFGAAASRLVVPAERALAVDDTIGEQAILLALAATAHHALVAPNAKLPDLIVGHGVLARMLARLAIALGGRRPAPVVWEIDRIRGTGAEGYRVIHPDSDSRRDYQSIYDVSGDTSLTDTLIARLAPGGELTLAGFYSKPISFSFAPAFIRESRIRIAAEWKLADLRAVRDLVSDGRLSLDGLITHRQEAATAPQAYRDAFEDPACLKMIIDWRQYQ